MGVPSIRHMTRLFLHRSKHRLIAGALLVGLLFQAMIPAGFMPATDGTFSLKICHSGFPAQSEAQTAGRHSGHSHVEYCPFGALPGAGPISHAAAAPAMWSSAPQLVADLPYSPPSTRFERAHPPRGPPSRITVS
jgi:hypothetical protein